MTALYNIYMLFHYYIRPQYFICLSIVSSPYSSETARVYAVTVTILLPVSCTWLRGRISAVPRWVSRPRHLGGAAGSALWGRISFPSHPDIWRKVQLVCVSTYSDSKTRSLRSFLTFCFGSRAFDVAVADASICLGVRA